MNGRNNRFNGYYNQNEEADPQILIENFTEISDSLPGDVNSLMESANNGKEIEDMIGRISFSGDDLSNPSDEEDDDELVPQREEYLEDQSKLFEQEIELIMSSG